MRAWPKVSHTCLCGNALITPAVGGLIAGLVVFFGARWRGDIATTDYMEAVVVGNGKLSVRLSIVKCLSSMFTIASGGSIGREVRWSSSPHSRHPFSAESESGPRCDCAC